MDSRVTGIKAHPREERMAVVDQLIPLWKKKFGDNLLGIAVSTSVARGEDQAYSDLELDVFLREKPENREDQYLQRVVDGMLIEAIYHTPENILSNEKPFLRIGISPLLISGWWYTIKNFLKSY